MPVTAALPTPDNLKPNPHWARLPLFNRKGWKAVRFGEVVRILKEQVDPVAEGVQRYDTPMPATKQWHNSDSVETTFLSSVETETASSAVAPESWRTFQMAASILICSFDFVSVAIACCLSLP